MNYIQMVMPQMQGVVMSDYGSGTITPKIRDLILSLSKEYDIPSIIDSRYAIFNFVGTDYVKQNDAELASAVGYKIDNEEILYKAAQEFLVKMQAKGILVTRGEKGMTLFEANGDVHNIPVSDKSEVFDVFCVGCYTFSCLPYFSYNIICCPLRLPQFEIQIADYWDVL